MFIDKKTLVVVLLISLLLVTALGASATSSQQPTSLGPAELDVQLGSAFTYQGNLDENGSPANGSYDFQFILYDALVGGAQVGSTVAVGDLTVTGGMFTAGMDFGNVFDGVALWMEIGVRPGASGGGYTILVPRQSLTGAPYALGLMPGTKINNASGDGLYVESAAQNGVYVESAGGDGVEVQSAGHDGVHIDSAGGVGVYIGSANFDGLHVLSAGGDGLEVWSAKRDGVYVGSAGDDGVEVYSAGHTGLNVSSAGVYGVFVGSALLDGVKVGSAGDDGVDVAGNDLAGYFFGDIQVIGSCTGCLIASFGVNMGDRPLQPGDIVSVQEVQVSGVDSVPMLMAVSKATAGQSLVGVVQGRAELRIEDEPRPDEIGKQLIPRDGPAQPGDYVTIITHGMAPVNVGVSLAAQSITAGTRLAVGDGGVPRGLQTVDVQGVQLTEDAPTVGLALSSPDKDGQVWVLVNPQ